MTDSFEKLYDENVNLRQEIQANEELLKTLTAEQAAWVEGRIELERVKDGVQSALKAWAQTHQLDGQSRAVIALVNALEALCTSKH